MTQFEASAASGRASQLTLTDEVGIGACFAEKWILRQRFVRKPAAAGLFPCELLVEEQDFFPARSQQFACECSRRTSSNDSDREVDHSDRTSKGKTPKTANCSTELSQRRPDGY